MSSSNGKPERFERSPSVSDVTAALKRIEDKLDALGVELNGDHQHPGLKGRVTKLETREESLRWRLRALYAAAVAFLVNAVAGWFTKGGQ